MEMTTSDLFRGRHYKDYGESGEQSFLTEKVQVGSFESLGKDYWRKQGRSTVKSGLLKSLPNIRGSPSVSRTK
jgi:major membrane immunogen (membrane-anchored lipoprotein)